MRKGRRQKLSGCEWDVVGSWKKFYCYLARSGVSHAIKKGMSRRFRRAGKKELRKELNHE